MAQNSTERCSGDPAIAAGVELRAVTLGMPARIGYRAKFRTELLVVFKGIAVRYGYSDGLISVIATK